MTMLPTRPNGVQPLLEWATAQRCVLYVVYREVNGL